MASRDCSYFVTLITLGTFMLPLCRPVFSPFAPPPAPPLALTHPHTGKNPAALVLMWWSLNLTAGEDFEADFEDDGADERLLRKMVRFGARAR